jgi:hypothetical protein
MEVDRLPDDFAIVDTMGEFASEPDDVEKSIYKELGLAPLHMKGGANDAKTSKGKQRS